MKKKILKKIFIFQINPSEFVALNCLYQESILAIGTQCEDTDLRFCILLTETFIRAIYFEVINKCGKCALLQI